MAKYAVLENNICANVVVCEPDQADSGWVLLTDDNSEYATIGAQYDSSADTFAALSLEKEFQVSEVLVQERVQQEISDLDWTQLPDSGLTSTNVNEWKAYRAKLRQLRDGSLSLNDWPDAPSKEYV